MPQPRPDPKTLAEAHNAIQEEETITAAASRLGIPRSTLNEWRREYGVGAATFEVARLTVHERKGVETGRSTTYRPPRGPVVLDPSQPFHGTVHVDGEGRVIQAWRKPDLKEDFAERFMAALDGALANVKPFSPIIPPADPDEDLLTLYPIPDAHVGQLSWGRETGQDYDLAIARKIVSQTIGRLVGASPSSGTACVVFLGDYMHVNDPTNQTPANKHNLDVDGRHEKVIDAAIEIALDAISCVASRHASVEVRVLPGNHDPDLSPWLARVFHAAFRSDERIRVQTCPGLHWFREWGVNFIGATHGHTMKQQEMPLFLANNAPKGLPAYLCKMMLSGHVHHQRVHESGGVICRSLPALGARDAYAASRGLYAHRGMVAMTFHRTRGPRGEVVEYLPTTDDVGVAA